jgi:hypothetical protein
MALDVVLREFGGLAREERRAALAVRSAQLPGQVAAAKIESAAFATHVALHHAGMLSAAEARLLQQAPLGEGRYRAIADAFAGYACHEIALLAHE